MVLGRKAKADEVPCSPSLPFIYHAPNFTGQSLQFSVISCDAGHTSVESGFMLKSLSADATAAGPLVGLSGAAMSAAPLSLVTTLPALRDLASKWRELEDNLQNHSSVFQSFDWVMAWAETYVTEGSATTLHVLAGYDKDQLVFLWPLMRTRQMGLNTLSWLTEPFGQYGDVMCRKGHCPKQWVESALTVLRRLKDIDLLRLRHVRADSHLGVCATQFLHNARVPEKAPFLDLTPFANEQAYDARYTSTQRKRRKKIRKAIEDMGPMTFKRLPVGSLADVAMARAIDEKNAWLNERGRINRVLGCPKHVGFLKNLSRRLQGSVEVVVTELKAGDQSVSWEVGFRHRNMHYGYITSHVNALTDLSPGRLHMDQSQRACINDGLAVFDLMVPNDAHKESWSSGTVETNDYYLPLSLPGAGLGHIYIRTLRPLLRTIYYKMEASGMRKLNWKKLFKTQMKTREET
jgi:CelD/BcsL family acetyltransferase involved in cellulose biosynthesis